MMMMMMMMICWKERSKKQITANYYSYLQSLSDDIHRIILSFYAKDWKDLIKFGSVCRSLKMVADHSSAWILLPKEFYASQEYFNTQARHMTRFENQDYRIAGDNKSRIIMLFSDKDKDATSEFFSEIFKIIVQIDYGFVKDQTQNILHQNSNSAPVLDYELAFEVRQQFMKIFVGYHRLWAWYAKWIQFFDPIRNFNKYVQETSFRHAGYGYYIFLLLAIILLADLPNLDDSSSSSFSIRDYFGFAFLYLLGLCVLYIFFISLAYSFLYELNFPDDSKLRHGFTFRSFSGIPPIVYSLGIIGSIILLQYKLVANDENISIASVSIPLLVNAFIAYVIRVPCEFTFLPTFIDAIIISFLVLPPILFAMPVSFLLVTLYYDDPRNIYSESVISSNADHPGLLLWCTTIPMIPFEFYLLTYIFIYSKNSFLLWKDYLQGLAIVDESGYITREYWMDRKSVRLFANTVTFLFCCIYTAFIIYLNILIGMNTIQLNQVFVISLSIILCALIAQRASQFDKYYV